MHLIEALSVAQVQGVLARAPVLFFITDRDLRFRAIAGAHAKHLHLPAEAASGASAISYFSKQQPASGVTHAFDEALGGAEAYFSFTQRGSRNQTYLYPVESA